MLIKIKKGINDPRKALLYILDYLKTFKSTEISEILDIDLEEFKTREKFAICIGFNVWKREYFKEYFPEYCLAFTRGRTPAFKVISVIKSLECPYKVFIWSYQEPKALYQYLVKNKIKIHRVEDGFIRSLGLGSDKTKPLSLVIDNDSIYFNPKKQSKLENIIFEKHGKYSEEELKQSEELILKIINNKITKYNFIEYDKKINIEIDKTKKVILVIGQVEDDMSIKLGYEGKVDNLKLLEVADKENPNCNIIFKPHPDIFKGNRKNTTSIEEYKTIAKIAPENMTLHDLIDLSDHIYTITSLAGFEALLKGKIVTCLGAPFYSNWGLTDDRQIVKRRRNYQLSIQELFYTAFVVYPQYLKSDLEHTIDEIVYDISYLKQVLHKINYQMFDEALEFTIEFICRNDSCSFISLKDQLNTIEYLLLSAIKFGKRLQMSKIIPILLRKVRDNNTEENIIKLFSILYMNRDYDFILNNTDLFLSISFSKQLKLLNILNSRPKRPDTNFSYRYNLIKEIKSNIINTIELQVNDNEISEYQYLATKLQIFIYEKDVENILKTYKLLEKYKKVDMLTELMKFLYNHSSMKKSDINGYLTTFLGSKRTDSFKYEITRNYIKNNRYIEALKILRTTSMSMRKLKLKEEIYLHTYQYDCVIETYHEIIEMLRKTNNSQVAIRREEEKCKTAQFLKRSSEILDSVPQPKFPSGLWIYTNYGEYEAIAMTIPIAVEAKKLGFSVISISSGTLKTETTSNVKINYLNGLISKDRESLKGEKRLYNEHNLRNKWIIDWKKRYVGVDGINYYQGIYEQLSMQFRRATIDIIDYSTSQMFTKYLKDCDAAHSACLEIEKFAIEYNIPVRLVSATAHGAPYSVYRRFAAERGYKNNIHFMAVNISYETYYSNLAEKTASTIAFEDVTYYHDTLRQPLLASKDNFLRWYNKNMDNQEILNSVEKHLSRDRVVHSVDNKKYLKVIESYKKNNKKVFCMFGKVLADLAVPYDGGPAHEDMVDYIKHTVEIFTSLNKDDLLLIKPHPHEERSEIAKDLTERMRDFIPERLPKNIVFLENSAFSLFELVDKIDIGLLWNGTAAMELGAKNKKVIMCSHFAKFDYPIKFDYPKSRSNYEDMLMGKCDIVLHSDIAVKSKMLLHYMSTDEIAIPFRYSHRRSTNDPIGGVHWIEEEVVNYLENGDKYMELCAKKLLKKYPKRNPNV